MGPKDKPTCIASRWICSAQWRSPCLELWEESSVGADPPAKKRLGLNLLCLWDPKPGSRHPRAE